jgi:hypothetical protein
VLIVAGVFALDRALITPYLDRRRALAEEQELNAKGLSEVRQVLKRERQLREVLVGIASAKADPSEVESRVLHHLHEWQREAGVGKASFQRVRAVESYGFTRVTFQASASGTMAAVAALLYRVETAPIPLRIDQLQIVVGKDGGDELQLQFSVSTLCRNDAPAGPRNGAIGRRVAAADVGGRP